MILPMVISIGWLFFLAYLYGRYEQKRLGVIELESHHGDNITVSKDPEATRPHLRKVNMVLTILLMIALIKGILPMSVLFMLAFCIAMLINYPDVDMQKKAYRYARRQYLGCCRFNFAAGILQVFYLVQAWLKPCLKNLLQ